MREVISLNGLSLLRVFLIFKFRRDPESELTYETVGQAGCQIANACWEVCKSQMSTNNG